MVTLVIALVWRRLATPGTAVVTVEAVENAGSSVSVASTVVQTVLNENLTLPDVDVVCQIIRASTVPVKSSGFRKLFCALNPPLVSAASSLPVCVFVPVTQAATIGVAVGKSQNDAAIVPWQPAAANQTL